jgi:asparagine synthase (glutamine-hydrolysing)
MCGIAGVLRVHRPGEEVPPPQVSIPETWLDTLDDSIKHRGPDGQGRFRDRARRADGSTVDVALVHRRLAIIDPACGQQPMVSERGKDGEGLVAVVFNGCIYNHRELRRELVAAGRKFETDHSDTEVLIHGWREWGLGLTERLEGMYSLAIWDRDRADLWAARDLSGEKPLWLDLILERTGAGGTDYDLGAFYLCSTAAGISRLAADRLGEERPSTIDWLGDWVRFGWSEEPPSRARPFVFWSVALSTSDYLGLVRDQRRPAHLRSLPGGKRDQRLDAASAEAMLRRAVAERLEADVPLGCFLSSGIDSALVARFALDQVGSLRTFSVRMPDRRYDESEGAARTAAALGTAHATLDCSAKPAEDLVRLIPQIGAPLGDSSLLPTYWVSRAAREHVKVALSGDGGDELFCGYDRHSAARWLLKWGWLARRLPGGALPDREPRGFRSRLRRLIGAARLGYAELLAIFPMADFRTLIGEDPGWYRPEPFDDPAGTDYWAYLHGDLMQKVDAASMSVGLEVRAPFLSRELVRACLDASYKDLMPRGQRKGLLRQVARKYLPAEIVDRPKQGFAIPIGEWFRTDYGGMKQLLMDHLNSAEPWGPPRLGIDLNMAFVRRMLDEHMERQRDHSQRLYMLLVLSIWAKWLGSLG